MKKKDQSVILLVSVLLLAICTACGPSRTIIHTDSPGEVEQFNEDVLHSNVEINFNNGDVESAGKVLLVEDTLAYWKSDIQYRALRSDIEYLLVSSKFGRGPSTLGLLMAGAGGILIYKANNLTNDEQGVGALSYLIFGIGAVLGGYAIGLAGRMADDEVYYLRRYESNRAPY